MSTPLGPGCPCPVVSPHKLMTWLGVLQHSGLGLNGAGTRGHQAGTRSPLPASLSRDRALSSPTKPGGGDPQGHFGTVTPKQSP